MSDNTRIYIVTETDRFVFKAEAKYSLTIDDAHLTDQYFAQRGEAAFCEVQDEDGNIFRDLAAEWREEATMAELRDYLRQRNIDTPGERAKHIGGGHFSLLNQEGEEVWQTQAHSNHGALFQYYKMKLMEHSHVSPIPTAPLFPKSE
jgi:hypothetical protein